MPSLWKSRGPDTRTAWQPQFHRLRSGRFDRARLPQGLLPHAQKPHPWKRKIIISALPVLLTATMERNQTHDDITDTPGTCHLGHTHTRHPRTPAWRSHRHQETRQNLTTWLKSILRLGYNLYVIKINIMIPYSMPFNAMVEYLAGGSHSRLAVECQQRALWCDLCLWVSGCNAEGRWITREVTQHSTATSQLKLRVILLFSFCLFEKHNKWLNPTAATPQCPFVYI